MVYTMGSAHLWAPSIVCTVGFNTIIDVLHGFHDGFYTIIDALNSLHDELWARRDAFRTLKKEIACEVKEWICPSYYSSPQVCYFTCNERLFKFFYRSTPYERHPFRSLILNRSDSSLLHAESSPAHERRAPGGCAIPSRF